MKSRPLAVLCRHLDQLDVGPEGSKEGETTNDLFAFLTTEPNREVGAVHPKAMPVILTTPAEINFWMDAPAPIALALQRHCPTVR